MERTKIYRVKYKTVLGKVLYKEIKARNEYDARLKIDKIMEVDTILSVTELRYA